METAKLVGQRSLCSRAQYGAVIVSGDNRIIAVGYNGAPAQFNANEVTCDQWCERAKSYVSGKPVDPDYMDCHAIHAEMNAILRAPDLHGLTDTAKMYVNGVTCLRCALLVANSGIKRIFMLNTPYEQKRDPGQTAALLKRYGVAVKFIDGA